MNGWSGKCGFFACLAPSILIGFISFSFYSNLNRERLKILKQYNVSAEAWQNLTTPSFFLSGTWTLQGDYNIPLALSTNFVNNPPLPALGRNSHRHLRLQPADPSLTLYDPFHWPASNDKVVSTLNLLYNDEAIFSQQFSLAFTYNSRTDNECTGPLCAEEAPENIEFLVACDVCFVMEDNGEVLPYVHSQWGCGVNGNGQATGEIVAYQHFKTKPSAGLQAPSPPLTISIRLDQDPWVIAGELTGDTYTFSPSQTQQHYLLFALLSFMFTLLQGLLVTWFCRGGEGVKVSVTINSPLGSHSPEVRQQMWESRESLASSHSSGEELKQSSTQQAYFRARLTNFYKLYNPKMLGSIDFLLEQYRGRETTLLRNLETKSYLDLPNIAEEAETEFDHPSTTLHSLDADAEETLDELRKSYTEKMDRKLHKKREAFLNDSTSRLLPSRNKTSRKTSFAYLRLKSLFERFNPDGLGSIDYLLTTYQGREMSLVEKYERRYIRSSAQCNDAQDQRRARLLSMPIISFASNSQKKRNIHRSKSSTRRPTTDASEPSYHSLAESTMQRMGHESSEESGDDVFDTLLRNDSSNRIDYSYLDNENDDLKTSQLSSEALQFLNEKNDLERGLDEPIHGNPFAADIRIASSVSSSNRPCSPFSSPKAKGSGQKQRNPFGSTDIRIASAHSLTSSSKTGAGRSSGNEEGKHGNPFGEDIRISISSKKSDSASKASSKSHLLQSGSETSNQQTTYNTITSGVS